MSHVGLPNVFGQSMNQNIGQSLMSFNQQAAQQYNAILAQKAQYHFNRQTYEWVWNGRPVSITEFAELAYGDTPQRTMFLLKHSDKKEN